MITERYVLANCMHHSDEVLKEKFFPLFQHEFYEFSCPANSGGYQSAIRHITPMTFEEWKGLRYREFREARHISIKDQLDMLYHDTKNGTTNWLDYVDKMKSEIPKP